MRVVVAILSQNRLEWSITVTRLRNVRVQCVGSELYEWLENNLRHSVYLWAT